MGQVRMRDLYFIFNEQNRRERVETKKIWNQNLLSGLDFMEHIKVYNGRLA